MKYRTAESASLLAMVLLAFANMVPAHAADSDLKTGQYEGTWCGYSAVFDIAVKERRRWVFHGKIVFPTYDNLADELWIEQYEDQSLRMIRYLSGTQEGWTQVIQTFAPEMHGSEAGYAPTFTVERANGPDCEGKPTQFTAR
ncbi:hypothetical protein [uncultured Devosia sp.]|uniref:hypothetical protein n=1 Tax=uncultured Devosia sp. TaxID=211434 RepID=UPI0035CAE7D9